MAALRAEVARFRDEPVTEAELDEAKNELVAAALRDARRRGPRQGARLSLIMTGEAAPPIARSPPSRPSPPPTSSAWPAAI